MLYCKCDEPELKSKEFLKSLHEDRAKLIHSIGDTEALLDLLACSVHLHRSYNVHNEIYTVNELYADPEPTFLWLQTHWAIVHIILLYK